MIIRVFNEGQYELAEGSEDGLHALDEACEEAIQAGDEEGFHRCYGELLAAVRERGTPLADDDLRGSDLMLPPADVSLQEAQRDFGEHGLIPD